MNEQKIKKGVILGLFFALYFLILLVVFLSFWTIGHFQFQHFGQILFHLHFPLFNAGEGLLFDCFLSCVVPALLGAVLILVVQRKMIFRLKWAWFGMVLFSAAWVVNHNWRMLDYFKAQREVSQLFEKHYQIDIAEPNQPTQNLVIIFMESFSSGLTTDSVPKGENPAVWAPFGNVIPQLGKLAQTAVNFSNTDVVGGLWQVNGTGWTIAGMVGYLCGIPLKLPKNKALTQHYFLNRAVCVPDILAKMGYQQIKLSGVDSSFAGTKTFFQKHHVTVHDLPFYQQHGRLPSSLEANHLGGKAMVRDRRVAQGRWGVNDRTLFSLALEEFKALKAENKPFALYISTMDTHPPFGFMDPYFCSDLPYPKGLFPKEIFTCSERVILDFVNQIEKIAPQTSVILLSDHLPHGAPAENSHEPYINAAEHGLYNVFLSPAFLAKAKPEKIKNRQLTHFDMAPLILESVGIPARFLGLGKNPLREASLLESTFSKEAFNQELMRSNAQYDRFWYPSDSPSAAPFFQKK